MSSYQEKITGHIKKQKTPFEETEQVSKQTCRDVEEYQSFQFCIRDYKHDDYMHIYNTSKYGVVVYEYNMGDFIFFIASYNEIIFLLREKYNVV